MKKLVLWSITVLFAAGVAAAFPHAAAQAQFGLSPTTAVPKITSHMAVATSYYKWIRETPPFSIWARHVPDAKISRSDVEWQIYLRQKPKELESAYSLVMYNEPINVKFVAVLSKYSTKNEGYLIKNIAEDTYFPYTFAGRQYAVIPQGLTERQWLPVSAMASRQVEDHIQKPGVRKVIMIITLEPVGAQKNPMEIDGVKRYLVAAKVSNLGIYSCNKAGDCRPLWNEGAKEYRDQEKNELLDLKQ